MKSLPLTLVIFILSLIFISNCGPKPEENPAITTMETKESLDPVTVDEFFEYIKNPQFENSEKIENEIPYYARRMFEVRTSRDAAELEAAKKIDGQKLKETLPLFNETETSTIEKVSTAQTAKVKEVLSEIENIYGRKSNVSLPELCTYLKKNGNDWKDPASLATGIMEFTKTCFHLSVEGGMPLDYVKEINGLSKDSVFIPTYLSQNTNTETSVVEQVQFIFNGILFRFSPMDQEEYYDSQIVVAAANLALRSKKSNERYYQLNDDSNVIFGTKEQVRMLCKKFGFKLK